MQRQTNPATPNPQDEKFDPYQNDGDASPGNDEADENGAQKDSEDDAPLDLIGSGVIADDAGMLDGGLTGNHNPER